MAGSLVASPISVGVVVVTYIGGLSRGINITGFRVVTAIASPGFLKRTFGNTPWGETLLMCGISVEVNDTFSKLDDLNHASSMALRRWSKPPLVAERTKLKETYGYLKQEADARARPPVSGTAKKKKGQQPAGAGQGRYRDYRNWSNTQVLQECDRVGTELDAITCIMQEGKLTSGAELVRPYRGRPMFVGALLIGFEGDWITEGMCLECQSPHDIARCSKCQCGICETHGLIIGLAGQDEQASGDYQGASLACCSNTLACERRQHRILNYWAEKTGEKLD